MDQDRFVWCPDDGRMYETPADVPRKHRNISRETADALRADHGMPADTPVGRGWIPIDELIPGRRYAGYRAHWIGVPVTDPTPPYIEVGGDAVHVYGMRVFPPAGPVYLQARWPRVSTDEPIPVEERLISIPREIIWIGGLENPHTAEHVTSAWRGLGLLRKIVHVGGRPQGTGTFATREDYRSTIRPVVQHIRRRGLHPSQKRVAEYLCEHGEVGLGAPDERQLRKWNTEIGGYPDWAAMLEDVLNDTA